MYYPLVIVTEGEATGYHSGNIITEGEAWYGINFLIPETFVFIIYSIKGCLIL